MRSAYRRTGLVLAGAALMTAPFLAGGQGRTYLLRYRFRTGQALRYRTTVNVQAAMTSAQPGTEAPAVSGAGTTVVKTLKVLPDGSAQVSSTQAVTVQGPGGRQPANSTLTCTLSPLGRIRGARMKGGAPVLGGLVNPDAFALLPALLPARTVAPGADWTSTMPNPLRGGKPVTVKTRFVKVEAVAGVPTARLQQSFAVPVSITLQQGEAAMKMSGTVTVNGTIHFATAAGRVVRSAFAGGGAIRVSTTGPQAQNTAPATIRLKMQGAMRLQP